MIFHNRLFSGFFLFLYVCFFSSINAQNKLNYTYRINQDPNTWSSSILSEQLTVEDKHDLLIAINVGIDVYRYRAILIKVSALVALQTAKINGLIVGAFSESYQETSKENIIFLAELVHILSEKENEYRLALMQLEKITKSLRPFIQDILTNIHQSIISAVISLELLTDNIKTTEDLALYVYGKDICALLTESTENITYVAEYSEIQHFLLDQQDIFAELFYKSACLIQPTAQLYFDISLLYIEMLREHKMALEYNLLQ